MELSLKYLPSPSLSFPVSDVETVNENAGERVLRFMGLVGVDSPLPHNFTYHKNILNSVSQVFYVLFYQAIQKSRTANQYHDYIQASFAPSRENLIKNLRSYLGGIFVEVCEFVPQWITINKTTATVGEMIIGNNIIHSASLITIKLGPLSLSDSRRYRADENLKALITDNISPQQGYIIKYIVDIKCEDRVVVGQWILH